MLRILLMHYVSLAFLEGPESGWADVLAQYAKSPPKLEAIQTQLFKGGLTSKKTSNALLTDRALDETPMPYNFFIGQ